MLALILGLTVLAAAGCGDDDDTATGSTGSSSSSAEDPGNTGQDSSSSLVGRDFLSESVTEDGQPRPLVEGTQISLSFPEDGTIGAGAGCNSMGGEVEIQPDRLVIDGLYQTEMACDPELMDQDTWLLELLDADPSYSLDGDRLRLESGNTVVELVDREVADPDRPLQGTTWQLDGLIEGAGPDAAVSSVPGEAVATITFTETNVDLAIVNCNSGGGEATVGEGTITFGPIATTRIGCPPDESAVETALTTVMQGEVSYQIDAGKLTLTHPDGKGLTFQAQA